MGVVYLAYDQELPRLVAVKLLRNNDPDLYERFAREARLAASLDHPNIVTIFDRGIHEGQPFIVMQHVAGETLEELIKRRASMSLARKLRLIADLCDGLAAAHNAGVVHRDVKPSNIKINREGVLKILDFGIARQVESGMTRVGSVIGTLNYMSPEQVAGNPVDHHSDQFAVGLVLYELLVFQKAFQGDERVVPSLIQTRDPAPLGAFGAALPADLIQVVNRAIRKSPGERYPDLLAMRRELLRIAEPLPDIPHLVPRDEDVAKTIEKNKKGGTDGNRSDPKRFAERRRAQIETLLGHAREALSSGDFDKVLEIGEQAAILDPDDQRILDVLAQATAGLEDRQVREWLDQARRLMAAGNLTTASDFVARSLELRPEDKAALTLQRNLSQLQEERERAAQRARAVQRATAHARRALQEEAFESAVRSASEALAIDPTNADAVAVRQQALAAIEARERHEEQVRQQREQAAQWRREEEEQRRREEEQRRREEALRHANEEAARIRAEAEAQARKREESLRRQAQAEAEMKRRADAEAEEHRRRQTEDAAARVASALIAEDLGAAEAALEGARTLGADERVVRQLRASIDACRSALRDRQSRGEHDRLAAAAVEASRQDFEGGRVAEALRRLESFAPPHPSVINALDGLRKIADAEERQRQAKVAAEEARRRRLVVEKLADARTQLARGAFADALASVSAALTLEPNLPEATELRREILQSQAEAERDQKAQGAVNEANKLAGAGKFQEAIQLLEDSPPHPLVRQSRDTLKLLAVSFERRASEAIVSAQQLFESENEAEAIAALSAFAPAHAKVSEACRALSARLSAIENDAAPTRVNAEELARQGRLEEAIALLQTVAPAPPSVRTALHSLREQYTRELQRRAARDRERSAAYDKAVEKVRTALGRGNVIECERLLTALRTDYPDAMELALLAEELARQQRTRPAPHKKQNEEKPPRLMWIAGAAAAVLLVAGAGIAYWLRTPPAPVSERRETTTSIPVPGPTAPPVDTGPPPPPIAPPEPGPEAPKLPPPPPGPEVTARARELLASGDRPSAIKAIENGLGDGRTRDAFVGFVDTYLGRVQSEVSDQAERARGAGATWAPAYRNAETESRRAQETSRTSRTESLQHLWNALDLYGRSLTEHTQARQVVERAGSLFQAGKHDEALDELLRPGPDLLQSPDAVALLQGMRGQAEARVQGARTRAVDSGASEVAGFRNADAAYASASSLLREGRTTEGIKALWDTERLFAAAILPRRPEPPRNPVEAPPIPPVPSGIGDEVLRIVLNRFKQAYDSGQSAQLEQAFPSLKDEVKNYRVQLGACRQVSIEFSDFRVLEREPSAATVRTRTVYHCVPKVGPRLPSVTQDDLFSLAPGPGGTWTITRKWK